MCVSSVKCAGVTGVSLSLNAPLTCAHLSFCSEREVKMVKMFQMKGLCSRSSFYVGFLVGTCSLYMVLHQAWFLQSVYPRHDDPTLRRLEDEHRNWRKAKLALFNLNHPHHIGKHGSDTR